MGEEFYAILKLVSGEEIFSLILVDDEHDADTVIVLKTLLSCGQLQIPMELLLKLNLGWNYQMKIFL